MRSFFSPSAKHPLPSSTSAGVLRRATADGARATEVSRDDATSLSAAVDTGLRSPAQALDAPTRALMEARFDWDFSKVRIHADAVAAESARALQARAYTVGNDIVFGKGEFSPTSHSGKSLLAHELAHTVQQRGTPRAVNKLGRHDDPVEQHADKAAARALSNDQSATPLAPPPDMSGFLRRVPIRTWGGDFDIGEQGYQETYVEGNDYVEGKPRKTVRPGVKFHLKFSPDPKIVDAQEIAFVQAVTTLRNDQPHFLGKIEESRSISAGDVGEAMHIDKFPTEKSPFITDQTGASFSDKKTQTTGDAEMLDTPGFKIWDTDSAEMNFTTSAVATKGKQSGAFYGAVQWGWKRAEKQKPNKIPLAPTASPLPGGSLFKRIAGLWDKSKTSGGEKTEHLPTVDVKYTTKKTQVVLDPAKPKAKGGFDLDISTQTQVTEAKDPTNKGWQHIIVTSGTHRGKTGWVSDPLSDTQPIIPKSKRRP